jgi:alkylation response protein AidB-like acyl-CoA dehydrogenase
MANQLGIQSLLVPEEYGGSGISYVEIAMAFEEMGRVLLCAPCMSTIAFATNVLIQSGDLDIMGTYLPGIASGETIATFAVADRGGSWKPENLQLRTRGTSAGLVLDGHVDYVLDGHVADLIIVAAQGDDGVDLFAVEGSADGLLRDTKATADRTRRLATLDFAEVPARRIESVGGAASVITKTLQLASVALAAEQLGGAQRCLDMAVDYAKERIQFGRAIGSFQAVKHLCADLLLEVESARSAAYYAAWGAAENSEELPLLASLAKAYCSDTYVKTASDNLQIHGGIGFTWEMDCHLFIRRAKSSAFLLGTASDHRELVAQQLGL